MYFKIHPFKIYIMLPYDVDFFGMENQYVNQQHIIYSMFFRRIRDFSGWKKYNILIYKY